MYRYRIDILFILIYDMYLSSSNRINICLNILYMMSLLRCYR